MMIPQLALTVLLAISAATTSVVDAHGKLLRPESRVTASSRITPGEQYDFVGEIEGKQAFAGGARKALNWGRTPQQNQRQFAESFTAAGYSTLRQFFQANDKIMKPRFPGRTDNECGYTDRNAAPTALPADGVLEWGHDKNKWGFQDNHYGPCEVWCDNTLVLRNDDCRSAFGKQLPARMKIDAAQCAGAKQLQFMWLAVHFTKWQYWFNCVPLAASAPAQVVPVVPTANNNTASVPVAVLPAAPATVPAAVTPAAGGATTAYPLPVAPVAPGVVAPSAPVVVTAAPQPQSFATDAYPANAIATVAPMPGNAAPVAGTPATGVAPTPCPKSPVQYAV